MRELKGIESTNVKCDYFRQSNVQFDMDAVCVTSRSGEQVIIDNADFEKLMKEYNRRTTQLEILNK